jgi:hypothetical protein
MPTMTTALMVANFKNIKITKKPPRTALMMKCLNYKESREIRKILKKKKKGKIPKNETGSIEEAVS